MTGAHLGGRGAGRRRSYSATAAPAWSAGVAAMVMGATMWIFGARCFGMFWQRTRDVLVMAYLCSWTRPNVSKAALSQGRNQAH